jgi:GntR family transcriptional regulator
VHGVRSQLGGTACRHNWVANALRTAIAEGKLGASDRVPGENQLMAKYKVSRWTARAALDSLVSEGIITKVPSVGTFVRGRPQIERIGMERYARSRWLAESSSVLGDEAARQGISTSRTIRELAEVEAPTSVAIRLGVTPKTRGWVRRRMISMEGRPHQIADLYYPLDVATKAKLTQADLGPGGDFSGLHHAGHSPTTIREEWSARMPDRVEAAALQLPPASPVLEFIRTIRDQDKRAVEVMLSVIAADATSLTYEFAVPD